MKYIMKYNENFDEPIFSKFDKVMTILERDCKPFLDKIKRNDIDVILRGARPSYKDNIDNLEMYKKVVRTDRYPLDTDRDITKIFDDEFEKRFGTRLRTNGVFTTKSNNVTSGYGLRYLFFPIGEYKYYWNPQCVDLYTKINVEKWYRQVEKPNSSIFKKAVNYITGLNDSIREKVLELVRGYKSSDLKDNTNQEIIFICKEYYLVDYRYYNLFMSIYLNKFKL